MIDRLKSLLDNLHKRVTTVSLQQPDSLAAKPFSAGTLHSRKPEPFQTARLAPPVPGRKGIAFFVDDVEPAPKPLWLSTLGEGLELRSGASILIMPDQHLPALATDGYVGPMSRAAFDHPEFVPPNRILHDGVSLDNAVSFPSKWADKSTFIHPLIQAVHQAFSDHRPLILSPDSVWLTIVQGFAHHICENAEDLRGRIVAHHGKKELRVQTLALEPGLWPELISQLTAQIRDNSDPFLYETLSCEFSTSTPTIKAAFEIALMHAYERYFEFAIECVCGIPKITLEGTPDDWHRIRDRIEVLATFDLDWWTTRLTPILDEFISTANGAPNLAFWQAIYKPKQAYAAKLATGWIGDLFPYLGRPSSLCRNPDLGEERINWVCQETSSNKFPGISLEAFPTGISRASVTVEFPDNSNTPIELLGGFFGISQSQEDNALAPIISWAVGNKDARIPPPRPEELENLLAEEFRKRQKARDSKNRSAHNLAS